VRSDVTIKVDVPSDVRVIVEVASGFWVVRVVAETSVTVCVTGEEAYMMMPSIRENATRDITTMTSPSWMPVRALRLGERDFLCAFTIMCNRARRVSPLYMTHAYIVLLQ
jgi:hypothetical protein